MSSATKTSYTMDMCSGPLLKKMLLFAVPLGLSTLLQLLFNAADLVVVSRFAGDNAMAAVGANTTLTKLMVNMFTGVSVGANVLAARERGAGEHDEVHGTVHTSMALSLVCGVLMLVLGLVGGEWILQWMQIPESILDQAALYLKIYFLGMPATMVYNFGAALLRSVGDTKRPLYYLTLAGVVNVILNLILVIFFRMDVAGVAIATVVSQVISAALVVRCLIQDDGDVHLDLRQLRIRRDKLASILRVGLPAGIQASIFSISNVIIQSSINSFGEIVIAGHSAANNIQGFIHCIDSALSATALSFTSQNIGARKHDRVSWILFGTLGYQVAASAAVVFICMNWGELLLGIYSQTPEVIAVGMRNFSIMVTFYVLCGIMNILSSAVRGLGYSMVAMVVSLACVCGFRMVWVLLVFPMPEFHTLESLYISYPISWIVTALIHFGCWCALVRKIKRENGAMAPMTERK